MKREFAINILILLVLGLLIKAFYLLGIDRQMQLKLGTESYGIYFQLLNFTLLFQFINDFGIQNYTNRYVSQNRKTIHLEYKDFAGVKIILSIIYGLCILLFAFVLPLEAERVPILMHLAFNQVLVSGIFFFRSSISGLGFYKTDSFISILDRILLIALGSFLLWHTAFSNYIGIQSFIWIQTISLSLTLVTAVLFVAKKQLNISIKWLKFSEVKKILLACLPFAGIYLFSSLYNKIDVFLIGRIMEKGEHESGIYAASMRLFEASSMISLAFGSLLLAMFSVLYNDQNKLSDLFKMSMNLLVSLTLSIVLVSCFYSSEIMNLLYHQSDLYWSTTFSLCMLAFIPASLNYIYGALFQAIHKENKLLFYYFIAFLISIGANLFMISHWGVLGAAFITIVTHSCLFLAQVWYIERNTNIRLESKFWLKIISFIILSTLLVYGIKLFELNWSVKAILSGFIVLFLAFVFRFINVREFIAQKNQSK
ncbi:MAG: polysaccharide biosynthesis C-terminal domain-containing protein [Saprospiraceae bacterium]|nr:polysaccharide biosynthesis C-terminal domain-containing protein [Saprospiraceae bacterium]MBK9720122.1 polysaccharide biosynthesis C-terminal domain-containing protein [Saprospiraceae bacterium]